MLSAFTTVLHVPNLSKTEHLLNVLEASEVFSASELKQITHHVHGKRSVVKLRYLGGFVNVYYIYSIFIGIKKLLALIDMSKQVDERHRVIKLITKLEEDGALEDPGMA